MIGQKYKDIPCKICDNPTSVYGIVDFNKSCEEINGVQVLPYSGTAVYYHQCNHCKFIFTVDFDDWSLDDFLTNVYNDEYKLVDPEYDEIRPKKLAQWILPFLDDNKELSILDYGAGTALFGSELNALGYSVSSWDPLWKKDPDFDKDAKFDVITAFEVLEHTPDPYETAKEIINFSKEGEGQLVIHTLTNDIIRNEGINYWYIAPRNGHVCMHSNMSLDILFDNLGMTVQHLAPNTHIISWKE